MIVIKMLGGDLEYVAPGELLWMREAFEHESKGAILLRIGSDRIYSIETLAELRQKFSDEGIGIAEFTPPETEMSMLVAAAKVREVEPSNPILHPLRARAVLKFAPKLSLSVRESVEEARSKLRAATAGDSLIATSGRSGRAGVG